MNTLIIGSSGKIGKFFAKKKRTYLTYSKQKLKMVLNLTFLKII